MAKYTRFDPRNKKANQHKRKTKEGSTFKRIKDVEKPSKGKYYENENIQSRWS